VSLPSYERIHELVGGKVPPPEKRVTRSGIRKYLMQIAATKPVAPLSAPGWYRLWHQIKWARRMTHALHITIPPQLWAEDRARLASKLVVSVDDIRFMEEKERALRWTRRRSHA
jgi:hypothetical protein